MTNQNQNQNPSQTQSSTADAPSTQTAKVHDNAAKRTDDVGAGRMMSEGGRQASTPQAAPATRTRIDAEKHTGFWKGAHGSRGYVQSGQTYDDYAPAYRLGWETAEHEDGATTFETLDSKLAAQWETAKGKSKLGWHNAKNAVRDAWNRAKEELRTTPTPAVVPATH